MKNEKNVTINGQKSNAISDLPMAKSTPLLKYTTTKNLTNATSVHSLAQKSQTLYRRATQKPIGQGAQLVRKVGRSMDIARSKSISHFASRPISTPTRQLKSDIGPIKHPLTTKVEKTSLVVAAPVAKTPLIKSAKLIKEEAITEALKKPLEKPKKNNIFKRHTKSISILSICAILLAVVYSIYFYLPSFSVHIASAQAGINATYPEYRPDGYSSSGPVSYSDGEVTINFHANTGNTKFAIEQSKSSWDSTALKNKVDKDSKSEFVTTEERGLTIYTYNNNHNAAWVNGGILYTISGDAPLKSDQICHIATSL
jgi:hypothetical protein